MTATEQMTRGSRITAKDLINLGVFTAIYVVAYFVVGMLGFIPILMVALPFLMPVITGIPFMLYATRVHTFGLVSIMGLIVGLTMFVSGHGWPPLAMAIVAGVCADLIMRWGGYASWPKTFLAFGVFSLWVIGAMLPMWVMRKSYLDHLRETMGDAYANEVAGFTANPWVLVALLGSLVIGVLIGGMLGRVTLRKHFVRAGIA
ncbi:MAG: MptD family putative ECF transporter S component [Brachybacterium sp.]|uniref:MptD family putative ECF transporter S component n=1 Tax=Microbacterium TaxID=33882 RepID=UPI003F9BECF2